MKLMFIMMTAALMSITSVSAKGECQSDRAKFCKDVKKGDHKAMFECMKSHEAELSEPCKAHRAAIREKSKDIQKACKSDYKKLCKGVKKGEGRIIKCLKSKEAELSGDCKSALSSTNIEHK